MSLDAIKIRRLEKKDIPTLRKLAADTAYFGSACENFFPDREFLSVLIMDYYLFFEPEHTWVADDNGEAVGYLSAGFDESSYAKYMLRYMPKYFLRFLIKGGLFDKRTIKLIWYNLLVAINKQNQLKKIDYSKYPVHIHQNMKQGYRGKGIGSGLVKAFLEFVDNKKFGVHFRALREVDNFAFFERYGFRKIDYKRVPIWEKWLNRSPLYFMEYVRESA